MLTKQTPLTIAALLTITAMGVETTLQLTYWNKPPDEYDSFVKNPENLRAPDGVTTENEQFWHMNAAIVLYLVKSFDDGTDEAFPLTRAGLIELERNWPGVLMGIVKGYHQSRAAAVEKN